MKVSKIILQINQGLVALGKYAPGRIHDSEILLALDVELGTLYNTVIKSKQVEVDSFTSSLLNDLKTTGSQKAYTIGIDVLTYNVPDNLETLLKASIIIVYYKAVEGKFLEIGKYYKPKPQAKINSVWTTEITKATEVGYNGKLEEVIYYKYPIRVTASEKIDILKVSPFYKSKLTSPLGELENNTLKVYIEDCYPDSVEFSYYKKPILFSEIGVNSDSPYSEIVNNELIKLVINNIKQR